MVARRKRQADPYAEQSTELEEEDNLGIVSPTSPEKTGGQIKGEIIPCGHANRSVNLNSVRKYLKQSVPVGECVHCSKAKALSEVIEESSYKAVIWLCAFCGYQGCDRNSLGKHSYTHYRTPRSDPHCIVINTQFWTAWCYECDSEILPTSSKKLHEVIQYVKRMSEMAPKRLFSSQLNLLKPSTNLLTQYSGSDSRLSTRKSCEDLSKVVGLTQRKLKFNQRISSPKVKGISNLGNTCFFNSVIQNLAETPLLTQILNGHLQSGEKVTVQGNNNSESSNELVEKSSSSSPKSSSNSEVNDEEDDDLDLKPIELFLPEGGPLSLAFSMLMKDMHTISKNIIVNPGYLFGLICKKSTQFQGYQQQDAHELLRCLLDAIRCEEVLRIKRAILKAFGLCEKSNPNTVNITIRKLIKAYGKEAFHTIIDQIFGGLLISTVFCEECHWSSQVFEPFMDLSLPLNEEKGKPKKVNSTENESTFGCFGRSSNGVASTKTLNSSQTKQRKERRDRKRGRPRKGVKEEEAEKDNISLTVSLSEDQADVPDQDLQSNRARRLTEKRRPEEKQEFLLRKEREEEELRQRRLQMGNSNEVSGESDKVRRLMAARKTEERLKACSNEEEDDEDDSDHGDLLGLNDGTTAHLSSSKRVTWTNDYIPQGRSDSKSLNEKEKNMRNHHSNSKNNFRSVKEISDADVEDNTDSDYLRNSYCTTPRHPSIVVEESNTDPVCDSEAVEVDSRLLNTYNSCDHLNYSSDCSERYFTAAGPDTMDELDSGGPQDSFSQHRLDRTNTPSTATTNSTSGKGDSISLSSGEIISCNFEEDSTLYNSNNTTSTGYTGCGFDRSQMEELSKKVGDMKFRRKSSSRESLLEPSLKGIRRDSLDSWRRFGKSGTYQEHEDGSVICSKTLAMKKMKQDWIARSLTTLAPRYQCGRQECSVMSCLNNFTAPELITGSNKITCENCTRLKSASSDTENTNSIKSNASKQLLILSPPAVLTLHLKRFHHVGYNLAKVNKFVQFPLVLDMAPFTSSISVGLANMSRNQTQVLYSLYGIVEHSGRLNSGHYVAYVRARSPEMVKTSKQMLNTRPWSRFKIDHLVSELAEQRENIYLGGGGGDTAEESHWQPVDVKSAEEEVKIGRWFHVSDTYVAEVNIEKVLKAQAYLLFYERIV